MDGAQGGKPSAAAEAPWDALPDALTGALFGKEAKVVVPTGMDEVVQEVQARLACVDPCREGVGGQGRARSRDPRVAKPRRTQAWRSSKTAKRVYDGMS